jgi:hypothetical protein
VHRVIHSQPRAVASTSLQTNLVVETATTRSVVTKTPFLWRRDSVGSHPAGRGRLGTCLRGALA